MIRAEVTPWEVMVCIFYLCLPSTSAPVWTWVSLITKASKAYLASSWLNLSCLVLVFLGFYLSLLFFVLIETMWWACASKLVTVSLDSAGLAGYGLSFGIPSTVSCLTDLYAIFKLALIVDFAPLGDLLVPLGDLLLPSWLVSLGVKPGLDYIICMYS